MPIGTRAPRLRPSSLLSNFAIAPRYAFSLHLSWTRSFLLLFFFFFFLSFRSLFFFHFTFFSFLFVHSFIHSFVHISVYLLYIHLFVCLFIYLFTFFVFLSLQRITARPPLHFPRRDTASPPTVSGFTFDCFAYIAVRTCRKGMLRVEKKSLRRMQRRPRLSHSAQGRAGTCMRIDNHASRFVENPDFRWRRSLAIVALPMVNDKPEPPSHSFSLR